LDPWDVISITVTLKDGTSFDACATANYICGRSDGGIVYYFDRIINTDEVSSVQVTSRKASEEGATYDADIMETDALMLFNVEVVTQKLLTVMSKELRSNPELFLFNSLASSSGFYQKRSFCSCGLGVEFPKPTSESNIITKLVFSALTTTVSL